MECSITANSQIYEQTPNYNALNIWSIENVKEYECEKYVKNNEKNCNKCGFKTQITAQDGWTFCGCHCPPYKGMHCAEIKECPLWGNKK